MDSPAAEPTAPPTNVIAALARVALELKPIEKLTPDERRKRSGKPAGEGERGITYAYRGIDQIAGELQPLLGKYGVVIVPNVVSQHVNEIQVNGRPWTDTTATVDWTIYGPGGAEDLIHARTLGLGRDNADKGPNKALTMAYKNLLLRLFSVGDSADDPDNERHERDRVDQPATRVQRPADQRRRGSAAQPDVEPDADPTQVEESQKAFERVRDAIAMNPAVQPRLAKLREAHGKRVSATEMRDPVWRALVLQAIHDLAEDAQGEGEGPDETQASSSTSPALTDGASDLGDALSEGFGS